MNFKFDGKSKCLSLGAYPSTSLLEAREKSDTARKQLNEGIDPAVARKLHIQANIEAARVTFEKVARERSEEHTSELQSLMRISYAVFCLKKKKNKCTNKETMTKRSKTNREPKNNILQD